MSRFGLSASIVALALALVTALLTTTPASATDIVVTQYKADPAGAVYGIALAKGFFKKHGSNVTGVVSGSGGGSSVRSAIASELGFGETSPSAIMTAILNGQDIRIVNLGSRMLDLSVVVMPDSPIKTIQDLKGKKFGISNPRSVGEMMGVMVLEKAGLKPADMPRVALGSLSGALTALEKGAVDATAIPSILLRRRGGSSKYRTVIGPRDLPPLPSSVGMATTKLMKEHPDQLRSLLAARREAAQFIYQHTDEAIKILSELYAPLPPNDVATVVKELVETKFWSEGNIEMQPLLNTVRAMKYVGLIDKDPDLSKMIDKSFLPADLQK
jgi:NitT/TauT family transport system substrate-binding protein